MVYCPMRRGTKQTQRNPHLKQRKSKKGRCFSCITRATASSVDDCRRKDLGADENRFCRTRRNRDGRIGSELNKLSSVCVKAWFSLLFYDDAASAAEDDEGDRWCEENRFPE